MRKTRSNCLKFSSKYFIHYGRYANFYLTVVYLLAFFLLVMFPWTAATWNQCMEQKHTILGRTNMKHQPQKKCCVKISPEQLWVWSSIFCQAILIDSLMTNDDKKTENGIICQSNSAWGGERGETTDKALLQTASNCYSLCDREALIFHWMPSYTVE